MTRNCNGIYSFLEWFLRAIILIFIGIASFLFSGVFTLFGIASITAGLIFISICFILFVVWDVLVTLGGSTELAWIFFPLDIVGALTIIFCLYSYLSEDFALIGLSAAFVIIHTFYMGYNLRDELRLILISPMYKYKRR